MGTIVSKFGGSSAANADCFRRILRIVDQNPDRRCIVLSAPGADAGHRDKVTSLLMECWRLKARGEPYEAPLRGICARYDAIARGLGMTSASPLCEREITRGLEISRPHALSRGEYLCAKLFSEWSGIPMVDAATVIAFTREGWLDPEKTARNIREAARRHARMILPGFYGSDPDGRVVTFPRNGSDISGALAAAGADADLYENWSDVPGLMTADPDIVPQARLIPQISYRQMRQLARSGAQVLHPNSLDPVAMAGIPTRLRCAENPDSYGTLIDDRFDRVVPCVAGMRRASLPGRVERAPAACATAFALTREKERLARSALEPIEVEGARDHIRFFIPEARFEAGVRALHDILLA